MHTTDEDIIQRVLDGDTAAFSLIVERYQASTYALVARLMPTDADAEEVTQDAFVRAYSHLSSFRSEADFGTWLHRIAYNEAVTALRRRRWHFASLDERIVDCVPDTAADAMLASADGSLVELLQRALQQLPPDDHTLLTLYYYEERSTRDIAYILDLTITNVTTRLSRARRRLYLMIKQLQQHDTL